MSPWVLLEIVWITGIILFYFKFWKSTVDKLKVASKSERVEIIKAVGFKKYVLIQAIFFGNVLAVTSTIITLLRYRMTFAKLTEIILSNLIAGLVIGSILWWISTRKPKEAKEE